MTARFRRSDRKQRRRRHRGGNACRGKARFGSWDEAKQIEPSQHPYACSSCGCFHLTSHPKVF